MDGPVTNKRVRGDEPLFLMIESGNETIRALIDTGASNCFMLMECRYEIKQECVHDVFAPLRSNFGR